MPFNAIFGWLMQRRLHQMELFKNSPIEVQEDWLRKLLFNGQFTDYGILHRFKEVTDYNSFRNIVPLQTYEEVRPWVNRLIAGEKALLWPTDTKMFAKSSGTTSDRSKYIPVTRDSLEDCHQKAGKDLLAVYYSQVPDGKLYKYKHLVVGGSAKNIDLGNDAYIGDLSALLMKNMPWWAEIRRTPSYETALLDQWEEKIARMATEASQEDVGLMVGVPSWTLVILKRILDITGARTIPEIWPNLECFFHGGVSFLPYKKEFQQLMGHKQIYYQESYNASEGFFGIQDRLDDDSLLLMLDYGIFYEFIPLADYVGIQSTKVLSLDEVEVGEKYVVVISTNGGLWRYIIGDTITFTEKYPFRFKIAGRTKSYINAFGEELMVDNAEQAMAYACDSHNAVLRDYTAAPIFMENQKRGGHEWLIEFERDPDNIQSFVRTLDDKLRSLNSDYDAKRTNDFVLQLPLVKVLPPGTFEDWLRLKGKLGGQHKVPRLANNREILEQIMQHVAV